MLRLLGAIPVLAVLVSACGDTDETRRVDAEALRSEVATLPGVTSAEVTYTSGNGRVLDTGITFRADVTESDVVGAALRHQAARARSSLDRVYSRLVLRVPGAGKVRTLTVSGFRFPPTETVAAEARRWYALAAAAPGASVGVEVDRPTTIDVAGRPGELDLAPAYRRVAGLPHVDEPSANWTFAAPSVEGGLPNLILRSTAGLPAPELVDAWDDQLAAARPYLDGEGSLELLVLPDVLVLVADLRDRTAAAEVPERSRVWPAVTGQLRALNATGRPFSYKLELPFRVTEVRSDTCPTDDGPWAGAITRYHRSLPGNRAAPC